MKNVYKAAMTLAALCLSSTVLAGETTQHHHSGTTQKEKWTELGLTETEQLWLADHNVINQGIFNSSLTAPFEFTDKYGEHQGLTSDYIKIVSERLGIKFNVRSVASSEATLIDDLRSSKIDIASFLPKSERREKLVHFSEPIINVPLVMLGRQGSPLIHSLEYLQNERVVVTKTSRAKIYLAENKPELELILVDDKIDGFRYVQSNQADVFIHNAYSIVYFQKKYDLKGLEVIGSTPFTLPVTFATNDNMKPLLSITKKVLDNMSNTEKRLIFDKWVNIKVDKTIDTQIIIQSIIVILMIISLIVGVFIFINRRLASKVSERTLELRKLSRHMENLRENEKAKLAREIHDELGHHLTSLSIGIRQLKDSLSNKINLNKANDLLKTVKETTTMSKKIMTDLRPSILEDLGLVAAIEWLGIEFSKRHKIQCMVKAHEPSSAISEELTVAIFRITQESLTNITKHANATRVEVILTPQDNDLLLLISDNGRGLVKGWESKQSSYGLIGIKERVLGLDGNISIDSAPNKGVQLLIRLPILSNTELT